MKKFPQFLKTNPAFYGLQFSDIGAIMIILYLAMIFSMNPIVTIILSGLSIIVMKVIKKNFDLTGFLVSKKKEIHLTDIDRGEK